ncbi:hypothetical protein B0H63DRAFT_458270 [Podospora didyma]|uniref:Fungal N-terminal domain-containing protein n=1 Tax=Podospora didyma TaxID=330526 RepID=A0AAE0P4W6_9PEZI|nr:hypothetical protein B0H63DRAFT_458270 [Podospora didyma]
MAEVLGLVASGIAVSLAADTVGGVVTSLRKLWCEVKDVPETIKDMMENLEGLGLIVTGMENELGISSSHPNSAVSNMQSHAIHRCRKAHKDLSGLAQDLSSDIMSSQRRKKLVARTSVVLKKDTLTKYERRLQQDVQLLSLALQIHTA